jgi:hypothetical protein
MTYDELVRANQLIKPTDIKGKDYAEVNQRVKAFRSVFPTGEINTKIIRIEDGVCIMRATVKNETGEVLATGTAYELENSTFINKTSYIENCETSAVGRALGFCGFGIDTSIASVEEVANAMKQQKNTIPIKNNDTGDFTPLCSKCGKPVTIAEHDFSVKKYKKILCRNCQK